MLRPVITTIILFVALQLSAQQQPVKYTSTSNTLLWEISGKDLKQPSYVFGTYHLAGKSFLDTLPGVANSFARTKVVVGEVVLEDEMKMAMQMMPLMVMKDQTLDKLLKAEEYQQVADSLHALSGMSLAMMNGLKPLGVQMTLLSFMSPVKPTPENPALDKYFQQEARQQNKPVIGLETIEEQGKILFNMPLDRQKHHLMKTVREGRKSVSQLFDSFKTQNLAAMEKAFTEDADYTVEEMDMLLKNRNQQWVKKLPAIMQEQPAFIAVGAGHLLGQYGLIALLKQGGYIVKPVDTKK